MSVRQDLSALQLRVGPNGLEIIPHEVYSRIASLSRNMLTPKLFVSGDQYYYRPTFNVMLLGTPLLCTAYVKPLPLAKANNT